MVKAVLSALIATVFVAVAVSGMPVPRRGGVNLVKPARLTNEMATTIALISAASPYSQDVSYDPALYPGYITGNLTALYNTSIVYAPHMSDVWAYLAGFDADRASDLTAQFAASNVNAIFSNRGGFGCTRIVDLVDYNVIAANPKVFMGYSDLTTFLLSIHFSTGLVTFHGPMGIDAWTDTATGNPTMNAEYVQRILFNNELVLMKNPIANATTTLVSGKATGRLVGGNLSLFVALLGTPYFPIADIEWEDYILFLEDVGEEPYHIDVLAQKLGGLKCPVFTGLLFGHNGQQFVMPIGVNAQIDADAGTIQLLESAMSD